MSRIKLIANFLIQPIIIGLGSSIFLYSYNNNLRFVDYFTHIPFWILIVRPTGLYWNQVYFCYYNNNH